jgi:hypothetical protein
MRSTVAPAAIFACWSLARHIWLLRNSIKSFGSCDQAAAARTCARLRAGLQVQARNATQVRGGHGCRQLHERLGLPGLGSGASAGGQQVGQRRQRGRACGVQPQRAL